MSDLGELLKLANHAAGQAGKALRENWQKWSVVEEVQGREVKVLADRMAEETLLAILSQSQLPIFSEEAGKLGVHELREGRVWAIDPLDGSVNYLRHARQCAVSVALLEQGKAMLGVVDCFLLDEQFTAVVGEGAWLNGKLIEVSKVASASEGILQTGVPARASPESYARFEQRLRDWQKIRMIGSAATALAQVAAGRADGYRESGSMLWDVAAGCALVEAAGGRYSISDGPLDEKLEVAASNGLIPFPE